MDQNNLPVAILLVISCLAANLHVVHAQDTPTITFDNQSGEPALVKLIGPTLRTIEVPNGQQRTINASGGDYYILTRYGSTPEAYRYARGDPFTVTQTATQYSTTTITLHKVIGGNYPTHPISAGEFDDRPDEYTTTPEAQDTSDSLIVTFEDGGKITVTNWTFVYRYESSDSPRGQFIIKSPFARSLKTKNLLLSLGKQKQRGISFEKTRVIPWHRLSTIEVKRDNEAVTITLVDGEILSIPRLDPSEDLVKKMAGVTEGKHVTWSELYLEGSGQLGEWTGEFSKRLDAPREKEPEEIIIGIRFNAARG